MQNFICRDWALDANRVVDPARLRAAREARDLSQAELARRAGVDQGTISKIESGDTRSPEYETVYRLARELGTTVEALAPGGGRTPVRLGDPELVVLFNEIDDELDGAETQSVKDYVRFVLERARQRRISSHS